MTHSKELRATKLAVKAIVEVPIKKCFCCVNFPNRRRLADLKTAPRPIGLCYRCIETSLATHTHEFLCSFCMQAGRKTRATSLREGAYGAQICDRCVEEMFKDLHARKGIYELDAQILGVEPPFIGRKFTVHADHVFYLGPFQKPYNSIYRTHIRAIVTDQGFSIKRADEIYSTRAVMHDIWQQMFEAAVIIAEVTHVRGRYRPHARQASRSDYSRHRRCTL